MSDMDAGTRTIKFSCIRIDTVDDGGVYSVYFMHTVHGQKGDQGILFCDSTMTATTTKVEIHTDRTAQAR